MFDTAARGIISQGGKSANAIGECLYRGPDGRKCAAGWVISDNVAAECEGQCADYIRRCYPDLFPEQGWRLLSAMQSIHDMSNGASFAPRKSWSYAMRQLAGDFDLSPTVLDDWEGEAARG